MTASKQYATNVADFYSTPQPCVINDCEETNEGQDLTGTIFLLRGYDSGPLCPNHYTERFE